MKKPYIKTAIQKKNAFSNNENKTWKKPKWNGKKNIKIYPVLQKLRKKRLERKALSRLNSHLKRKRLKSINWRRFMLYWGKIDNSFVEKINEKMVFWNKLLKDYYMYIDENTFLNFSYTRKKLLVNWQKLKKNHNLTRRFNLVKYNKRKSKYKSKFRRNFIFFKKNYSLGIKHILYQSSVHFFRKKYKKKILKRNNKNLKSFFFKSLEMNLIKFSLIDDRNWFNFFAKNQTFYNSHPLYNLAKSKRIKLFFDIFTKSDLFNQIKQIKFLYSRHYFRRIHNKRNVFADFDSNKQKFPWWEALMFTNQTYKHRLSWRGQQFWFHNPFLLYTFKYYYRYKKPWEEKKKSLYSNFSHLVFNMTKKNILEKPKRVKQLLNKIVLPFYGHIKPQQLRSIYRRSHFVKSKEITSSNLLLNNLENRLDILVYRLNLAPNIVWARRLIKAGLVFLQRKKSKNSVTNYFQKKKLFPIKLNNNFDLYPYALNDLRIKKFYFKTQPILKTSFKTKPGDIIQCHPFSIYQKWNIRPDLLNKPVPAYLLTKTKIDLNTEWNHWYHYLINNKKYLLLYNSPKRNRWKMNYNFKSYRFEWDQELSKETTSFFLFKPKKKDFFVNDRNSPLFLNWTTQ